MTKKMIELHRGNPSYQGDVYQISMRENGTIALEMMSRSSVQSLSTLLEQASCVASTPVIEYLATSYHHALCIRREDFPNVLYYLENSAPVSFRINNSQTYNTLQALEIPHSELTAAETAYMARRKETAILLVDILNRRFGENLFKDYGVAGVAATIVGDKLLNEVVHHLVNISGFRHHAWQEGELPFGNAEIYGRSKGQISYSFSVEPKTLMPMKIPDVQPVRPESLIPDYAYGVRKKKTTGYAVLTFLQEKVPGIWAYDACPQYKSGGGSIIYGKFDTTAQLRTAVQFMGRLEIREDLYSEGEQSLVVRISDALKNSTVMNAIINTDRTMASGTPAMDLPPQPV